MSIYWFIDVCRAGARNTKKQEKWMQVAVMFPSVPKCSLSMTHRTKIVPLLFSDHHTCASKLSVNHRRPFFLCFMLRLYNVVLDSQSCFWTGPPTYSHSTVHFVDCNEICKPVSRFDWVPGSYIISTSYHGDASKHPCHPMLFPSFSVDGLLLALSTQLALVSGSWSVLSARLAVLLLFSKCAMDTLPIWLTTRFIPVLADLGMVWMRFGILTPLTLLPLAGAIFSWLSKNNMVIWRRYVCACNFVM